MLDTEVARKTLPYLVGQSRNLNFIGKWQHTHPLRDRSICLAPGDKVGSWNCWCSLRTRRDEKGKAQYSCAPYRTLTHQPLLRSGLRFPYFTLRHLMYTKIRLKETWL